MEPQSLYPRFRHYYKKTLVPLFEKPQTIAYTIFVLSFFTISIFGMFAIRPTLATIAQLKRHIEDQKLVNQKMEEKITKLRIAEIEYKNLSADFDAIFEALPKKPQTASLLGKLNRALVDNNVDLIILQLSAIPVTAPTPAPSQANVLQFTLNGKGSYESIVKMVDFLSRTDRIITLDSVDIASVKQSGQIAQEDLTVSIRGKSYILWEYPKGDKSG